MAASVPTVGTGSQMSVRSRNLILFLLFVAGATLVYLTILLPMYGVYLIAMFIIRRSEQWENSRSTLLRSPQ